MNTGITKSSQDVALTGRTFGVMNGIIRISTIANHQFRHHGTYEMGSQPSDNVISPAA